jgi:hypothetical protein
MKIRLATQKQTHKALAFDEVERAIRYRKELKR